VCAFEFLSHASRTLFSEKRNVFLFFPFSLGIHGNDNNNVIIQSIHFRDFEVAAVSLNNVRSLIIEDCNIERNRQDIPVLGMFSAARFIRYVENIEN
jgi:hypothetical protein